MKRKSDLLFIFNERNENLIKFVDNFVETRPGIDVTRPALLH